MSQSVNTFLVSVPDRTADTFTVVVSAWMVPRTKVVSDCWAAYQDLEAHGYTHRSLNHSIAFIDERLGAYMNTIERTWLRVKAFINPYSLMREYVHHLAPFHLCGTMQKWILPHGREHGLKPSSPTPLAKCHHVPSTGPTSAFMRAPPRHLYSTRKKNMHQRHLTAEFFELMGCTCFIWPTRAVSSGISAVRCCWCIYLSCPIKMHRGW